MSKEKRRVPKLRFPGFTEDWEQRKADYIFKSVTEKGYPELPVLSASQELGMVYRDQNGIDIQHDKKNESSYKRVSPGQFVIHLRSFQGGFAYSEVEGITSPAYTVMSFKNSSEQYGLFWKYVFKSETFIKRLETITYGIRDGRSISFSDFKSLMLQYPSFSEQELIGDLIAVIERGITLHQRKLDNLKLKKKALLQKLFPKNGERYPELRFPGFTDTWEQRKLGDYLIQYTEITTQNNQYPVLTSSRKGLFFQTDYYDGNQIASKDNTGYNIVPYGYFTYRHMSDDEIFHFNINYIVDKGIVSTLYPVFTTKNLNSNYLQLQLNYGSEFRKYAVLLKQGGSRTYMYFNKLKDLKLTISTSIDEQEIIAKFFISFEKLITLHQRKLDHLKLQKKALLQQMFV